MSEMQDSLMSRCIAFVEEQSAGEWGDEIIQRDAAEMAAFIRVEIIRASAPLIEALEQSRLFVKAYGGDRLHQRVVSALAASNESAGSSKGAIKP